MFVARHQQRASASGPQVKLKSGASLFGSQHSHLPMECVVSRLPSPQTRSCFLHHSTFCPYGTIITACPMSRRDEMFVALHDKTLCQRATETLKSGASFFGSQHSHLPMECLVSLLSSPSKRERAFTSFNILSLRDNFYWDRLFLQTFCP
jgi:hypothetical protein